MTRTGPARPADAPFAAGRLANARAFLEAAEVAVALAEPGDNANPILSHVVHAVIAYTDALTVRFGGRVNQKNHDAAVRVLRAALGNRLPRAQETRVARILGQKDAVQYGARQGRLTRAMELLEEAREFARWAESTLWEP